MKKTLVSIIASLALTGAAYADFGVGISGAIAVVDASGSETTTKGTVSGGAANTNSKDVQAISPIASIFAEYITDGGIAIGLEHVPGSADVSDKTHSRTENAQGVSGTDATGTVTRTADAEVENFNTLYIDYPIGQGYVKLGYSQIDVITKENAITSSGTYGDATLDGVTVGAGVKGELGSYYTKYSVEYTDFEELKLTSTTSNTIKADLDVLQFKFSIGRSF